MPISLLWSHQFNELTPLTLKISDKSAQTLGAHFATMLVASNQTFELLLKNTPFKEAFLRLWGENLENKQQTIRAQKAILKYLVQAPHVAESTLSYLYKLNESKMIKDGLIAHVQNLTSQHSFEPKESLLVKIPQDFDFHGIKDILLSTKIDNDLIEQSHWMQQWNEISQSLSQAKFSVGITGVMNAGKSTMLNALLGGEILGTSTVPETANLAIITHAKKPHAKVHFWSKDEWNRIEKSALTSPPMAKFVEQTKDLIGSDWDGFITKNGFIQSIEPKELAYFTSATLSKGRCNIVKSVELALDISFCAEGVSIVDTPGLDDPIIQREEITKSYLANCDAMVHLMNASQSATKKDVDFIIDALTYQRVAHLILVITRIDGVDEASLKEVIEYTKNSIEARLKALDKPHLIDPILAKITIFPVAGLYALMHKTGKEEQAIANGWSLEKTGIEALEKHLKEVLFGGERAHIMLRGASKSMLQILQNQAKAYENERELLNQSCDELEKRRQSLRLRQEALQNSAQKANLDADELILTCKDYLSTMEQTAKGRLSRLQTQIYERLSDDVRYSIKKTKQLPKGTRLETIVTTAIGDGLVDSVREYRFELFQYVQSQLLPFVRKHEEILGEIEFQFDPKAYQEEAAKSGILSTNYTLLAQNIKEFILSQKPKNVNITIENVRQIIAQGFEPIQSRVLPLLHESGEKLIKGAKEKIDQPILQAIQKMEQESTSLERVLLHVSKDASKSEKRDRLLKGRLEELKTIQSKVLSIMEVL